MQVYKIIPTTEYSYGCALIAANSKEEAAKLFRNKSEYTNYQYYEYNCVCNIVDKLTYDCIKPTIILDTIGAD